MTGTEVALSQRRNGMWRVTVSDPPRAIGRAETSSQACAEAIAQAWAATLCPAADVPAAPARAGAA